MQQGLEIRPVGFSEKVKKGKSLVYSKGRRPRGTGKPGEESSNNPVDITVDGIEIKEDLNLTEGDEVIKETLNLSQLETRRGSADKRKKVDKIVFNPKFFI